MAKKSAAKIYIGLVGEKGGGKDTIVKFVKKMVPKQQMVQVRFSDILTDTLNIWALPRTRGNYQKLSPAFRKTYGPDALSNAVRARAESMEADIIFLDGIRWWEDVKMLRLLNRPERGAKSFLVYVTAPAKIRYQRLKKRGEKAGERKATLRQFMKEEKARTEIDIPKIAKRADLKIVNGGTMKEFYKEVKQKLTPLIMGKEKS